MLVYTGYKSKSVADYLLWLARVSGKAITPMQLLKLTYICHGWMLGLYARPLTTELAEAWKYGPVLPSVYHDFKKFGASFITDAPERPMEFDAKAESVMKQVWEAYSNYNGIQLSALTHKPGTPWEITMKTYGQGSVISNDLIEQHYRELAQKG